MHPGLGGTSRVHDMMMLRQSMLMFAVALLLAAVPGCAMDTPLEGIPLPK